ncbi:hypothetical protein PUNSTDRAFT_122546 [Punctularia strigosozonata HHB-11173 SS5]|uniref:Pentacotripeptide-repeat region of PRORP domain-containing protein n=1 Tax=Punctularia strigosozonata (strain HHB-11173) TaxID=741275 RepID=R7S5J6_PUNST|nr:uncharacterized protein PUNSTDRAFT_122546 [Punctularia strigosozonata HHB-11173 SS5]EIN05304.1 hypothetical protein PUNSTDRAFT_122546 [Punctularia strigosozonata HHB-11173 SS5]
MSVPPTLVDLTRTRMPSCSSGFRHSLRRGFATKTDARHLQQVAYASPRQVPSPYGLASAPTVRPPFEGLLKRPRHPPKAGPKAGPSAQIASEQENRIGALREAMPEEEPESERPHYSEDYLMSVYEDLLALPTESTQQPETAADIHAADRREEDKSVVEGLAVRLAEVEPTPLAEPSSSFAGALRQLRAQPSGQPVVSRQIAVEGHETRHRVLRRLQPLVQTLEAVSTHVAPLSRRQRMKMPAGVVLPEEWGSLIRHCVNEGDGHSAEIALDFMKRYGAPVSEEHYDEVLSLYANTADPAKAERFIEKFLPTPTEHQRDLHVKSHLRATPPGAEPSTALATLHAYESRALPAPMRSYSRSLKSLFDMRTAAGHARAWDLFAHMRYVAHPHPDTVLYAQMIRACAFPLADARTPRSRSDPERALDLWTEMQVGGVAPTQAAYNAVILACARSGRRRYVAEAFRLAKEMLDGARDARGVPAFRPAEGTFCALLEGAKRVGELGRARWILAEMVREEEGGEVRVTEEAMLHVFHAYAAYKPPFVRGMTVLMGETEAEAAAGGKASGAEEEAAQKEEATTTAAAVKAAGGRKPMSHIPPQAHNEVADEATFLFAQIRDDTAAANRNDPTRHFRYVQLTPRLVNAYLSVHYAHSPIDRCRELWFDAFEGVERNPMTYVEALERCAIAKKGRDRQAAQAFAEEVWSRWGPVEEAWKAGEARFEPRLVERAHIAMIRTVSLAKELDRATEMVRHFATVYPPERVKQPSPLAAPRSARTMLYANRPLVRLVSAPEIPDDHVPPLLTFADLEILHHRLVAAGRIAEVGYIKWVSKAYEGALRRRRDATMGARPEPMED